LSHGIAKVTQLYLSNPKLTLNRERQAACDITVVWLLTQVTTRGMYTKCLKSIDQPI